MAMEKLSKFISKHNNLPPQRTFEWNQLRSNCIGGSEFSIITGDNPYCRLNTLIRQKVHPTTFWTNDAMMWGNMFEIITHNLCKQMFSISCIYELSSVPSDKTPNVRYSPDGLCVMNDQIVLFEIKCPHTTIPEQEVPKRYMPQIQLGLWVIDVADVGLFINNLFRLCKWKDFDKTLNFIEHPRDPERIVQSEIQVNALGMMYIYATRPQLDAFLLKYKKYINEMRDPEFAEVIHTNDTSNDNIQNNPFYGAPKDIFRQFFEGLFFGRIGICDSGICDSGELPDLSRLSKQQFNVLFKLVMNDELTVSYSPSYITKEFSNTSKIYPIKYNEESIDEYRANCIEKYNELKSDPEIFQLGYLCWKLLKSEMNWVTKKEGYVEQYLPTVDGIMQTIREEREKKDCSFGCDSFISLRSVRKAVSLIN